MLLAKPLPLMLTLGVNETSKNQQNPSMTLTLTLSLSLPLMLAVNRPLLLLHLTVVNKAVDIEIHILYGSTRENSHSGT